MFSLFIASVVDKATAARIIAEVASSASSNHTSLPPVALAGFTCRGDNFSYPENDSDDLQLWIEKEVAQWMLSSSHEDVARPELSAASNVLSQIATPLGILRGLAFKGRIFRWAVFAPGSDAGNALAMQAVALVEQDEGSITVHGIVSRRSFLNDAAAVSGGGKALLSSLLQLMHREDPDRAITLLGSPGDSFVDALYRKHGMKEIGRTEDDYAKLQLEIAPACTDFMADAILCGDVGLSDYTAIAWRLVPFSDLLKRTCAHTMPAQLYKEQISKSLGFAQ
jgi:hypothetical protein